jgi:hypothetical protein
MRDVKQFWIRNEQPAIKLFSIPDPIDIIWKQQFSLLGKYAPMNPAHLPCQFLTTWVSEHGSPGGQHYTLVHKSYVDTLQHVLPNVPDNGSVQSWLPLAQNHEHLKQIGTEWIKHWQSLTIYQYGHHPLFGESLTTNINGTYKPYSARTQ